MLNWVVFRNLSLTTIRKGLETGKRKDKNKERKVSSFRLFMFGCHGFGYGFEGLQIQILCLSKLKEMDPEFDRPNP